MVVRDEYIKEKEGTNREQRTIQYKILGIRCFDIPELRKLQLSNNKT
jgi:hypothetical protein